MFPVIDLVATGENITRLRKARGLTVRDLQSWFGFEEPQAIYKWQKGKSLPTVDNLYALGTLLNVPMEEILVPCKPKLNMVIAGQQDVSCCPDPLPGCFEYGRTLFPCFQLLASAVVPFAPYKRFSGYARFAA
jgi:transcriptional regulator with XRE-family HTH domain